MSYLIYCYAKCRYSECCNAECRYAECRYVECRYAECSFAECLSAVFGTILEIEILDLAEVTWLRHLFSLV